MARPCSGLARGCSNRTPAPSWGSQMPVPAGVVAVTPPPPAVDISHPSLQTGHFCLVEKAADTQGASCVTFP